MGADRQLRGLPHDEVSAEPGMRAMGEVLYREDYGLAELCPSSLPVGPCLFPRRPHALREETTSLLARVLGPWIALSPPSLDASLYIPNGIDTNNEQPFMLTVDVRTAPSGALFEGGKLGSWADKCRFWDPRPHPGALPPFFLLGFQPQEVGGDCQLVFHSRDLGPSGCVQTSDGQLHKLSTEFCAVCPMSMGLGGQVSSVSFSVAVVTTQCLDSGPGPSSS